MNKKIFTAAGLVMSASVLFTGCTAGTNVTWNNVSEVAPADKNYDKFYNTYFEENKKMLTEDTAVTVTRSNVSSEAAGQNSDQSVVFVKSGETFFVSQVADLKQTQYAALAACSPDAVSAVNFGVITAEDLNSQYKPAYYTVEGRTAVGIIYADANKTNAGLAEYKLDDKNRISSIKFWNLDQTDMAALAKAAPKAKMADLNKYITKYEKKTVSQVYMYDNFTKLTPSDKKADWWKTSLVKGINATKDASNRGGFLIGKTGTLYRWEMKQDAKTAKSTCTATVIK